MSKAVGGTPEEARQRLIRRSMEDEEFRQRLLADPKATVEQEIEAALPEEIEVRVVEETLETIYLVLPPSGALAAAQTSGELSDRELEAVAGGWDSGPSGGSTSDMYSCEADAFSCPPYKLPF